MISIILLVWNIVFVLGFIIAVLLCKLTDIFRAFIKDIVREALEDYMDGLEV